MQAEFTIFQSSEGADHQVAKPIPSLFQRVDEIPQSSTSEEENLSSTKRLRWFARASQSKLPPFRRTGRDEQIIQALYHFRGLTPQQVSQLFFNGKQRNTQCEHRLKCLYHHEYIFRRRVGSQLMYFLDELGANCLAERQGINRSAIRWVPKHNAVKALHVKHLICKNNVKIALEQACRVQGITVDQHLDESTIRSAKSYDALQIREPSGRSMRAAVIPDSFYSLSLGGKSIRLFIEADRRTEKSSTICRKILAYKHYQRMRKYRTRYGAEEGEHIPVLFVTTGERRMQNLLTQVAENIGLMNNLLFSTYAKLNGSTFFTEPVWRTVESHRDRESYASRPRKLIDYFS